MGRGEAVREARISIENARVTDGHNGDVGDISVLSATELLAPAESPSPALCINKIGSYNPEAILAQSYSSTRESGFLR